MPVLALALAAIPGPAPSRAADDVPTPAGPSASGDWLSPTAVAASPDGNSLYLACATGHCVVVLDLASGRITRTIPLPGAPSGLTRNRDGSRVYVTCAGPVSTICELDPVDGKVLATIPAGHTATSPVLAPDGRTLYVCERFDGTVAAYDLAAHARSGQISVEREPIAAAITPDGKALLVAHHLPEPRGEGPGAIVAAAVSVLDPAAGKLVKRLVLPNGSGLLRAIQVAPDGRTAAVVHNLARFQMPTTQLDRGWMNTSAVSLIDVAGARLINTVLLDNVDHGAANPWALDWTPDSHSLLITHAGTHELSVIGYPALLGKLAAVPANASQVDVPDDLAFLVTLRQRLPLAGNGPRALAVADGRAFVAHYFSDTLDVVDLAPPAPRLVQTISLHPPRAISPVRLGEMLFNDATRSFQSWQSCGTCHSDDGRIDGLTWDLLNDGIGNPKSTKSLVFAHRTPPAMSLGVRETAEMAVRAGIRHILMTEQPEDSAVALDEWLKTLEPMPSPHLVSGQLSSAADRGRALFERPEIGCARCHAGELFTDLAQHDVGTRGLYDRTEDPFDTPTLREVWRTAPYLHDGSAHALRDVLTTRNPQDRHGRTAHLTKEQIDDLVEYLRSL